MIWHRAIGLISAVIMAAIASRGVAQEGPVRDDLAPVTPPPDSMGWQYRVMIPIGDSLAGAMMSIDRNPFITASGAWLGWRCHGSIYAPGLVYYNLYGTTDMNGHGILTVKEAPDSIAGYLEGCFDGAAETRLTWHPSANPSAAVEIAAPVVLYSYGSDGSFEADFIPFWNRFRDALRHRDRRAVAAMTRFPLRWAQCLMFDWEKEYPDAMRRGRFIASFDAIFDGDEIAAITAIDALEIEPYRVENAGENYPYLPGIADGTLLYCINYYPGYETLITYCFMRVGKTFRLVHYGCVG